MPLHYDGEVQIYKVPHMSAMNNNGYILRCPNTGEAVIIDTPGEPEKLLNEVGDAKIKAILITPRPRGPHCRGACGKGRNRQGFGHPPGGRPQPFGRRHGLLPQGRRYHSGGGYYAPGDVYTGPHPRRGLPAHGQTSLFRRYPLPRRARRQPLTGGLSVSWWKASPPVFWSCRRIPTSIPATATTRPSARPKKNTQSSLRSPTRRTSTAK